jgi:hypothetical protein
MTFDEEKSLVDNGYIPFFNDEGSNIIGWKYPQTQASFAEALDYCINGITATPEFKKSVQEKLNDVLMKLWRVS